MDKPLSFKEEFFTIVITAFASAGMTFMSFSLAIGCGVLNKILNRH